MSNRLRYIDSLRGIAIVGVIVTHVSSLLAVGGHGLWRLPGLGAYGVQLFFVVSAFTIYLTFDRGVASEKRPVANFFIRRLMRIVPVYWFGILLYTAVYGLGSRGWKAGPEVWHYPFHFFLLNLFHPEATNTVVPGGWSISCEVAFYATVPIWFCCVRTLKSAMVFSGATLLAGPIAVKVLKYAMSDWTKHFSPNLVNEFYSRSIFNQIGCFSCGILLFFVLRDAPKFSRKFRRIPWNICIFMSAACICFFGAVAELPIPKPNHFFAVGFALAAFGLSQIPWKILVNPVTEFTGKVSYSAYLLHFLVIKQVTIWLPASAVSSKLLYFVYVLVVSLAVTIPLAYFSHLLIEVPCMKVAKRWIVKREAVATPISLKNASAAI